MGTDEAAKPTVKPLRRQVRRPGLPRPHVHKVRVSAEQEAELVARAEAQGWTVPRLLVEAALAGSGDTAAAKNALAGEMFRVVQLFGRVANNINQMTRATNATGQVQPGSVHALAAIERVCDRFHQVLDQMGVQR